MPPRFQSQQISLCDTNWLPADREEHKPRDERILLAGMPEVQVLEVRARIASLQFVALCLSTLVASMASVAAITIAILGTGFPATEFLRGFLEFCGVLWAFVAAHLLTQTIDWARGRGPAVLVHVRDDQLELLTCLGAPMALHRLHRACTQCLLVMGSFLCILGCVLVAMSLTVGAVSLRGLGIGMLASFAGLWMFVYLLRRWSIALVACSGGFVKVERGTVELWPWEEIATVRLRFLYENKHCEYLIARQDGARLSFDENFEYTGNHLGIRLQHAVCNCHLRELLLTVSGGRMAAFGPIQVGADGILAGSLWLPWDEDVSMERHGDFLTIRQHGDRVWRERIERIPNLALLHSLAEHLHTLWATTSNSNRQVK